MTTAVFTSLKGSPGTTTLACALAAVWPLDRRIVLAECDPAGSDLIGWFGLEPDRGLLSLAASVRGPTGPPSILKDHLQTLPGGLEVLAGSMYPDRARAIEALWPAIARVLWLAGSTPDSQPSNQGYEVPRIWDLGGNAGEPQKAPGVRAVTSLDYLYPAKHLPTDILIDAGRVFPISPSTEALLVRASIAVVVIRPGQGEALAGVARQISVSSTARVVIILVGGERRDREELEAQVNLPVLGPLAFDPAAAAMVAGRAGVARKFEKSALLRTARPIADEMAAMMAESHAGEADGPPVLSRQDPGQDTSGPGGSGWEVASHTGPGGDQAYGHGIGGSGGGNDRNQDGNPGDHLVVLS